MTGDEAVGHGHDRQHHIRMLGDANRLNEIVVTLLGVFAIELNPAGIARTHGIGVITVDVQRSGYGAVHYRHDDGRTGTGRHIEHLVHKQKALRRGCRHGARTCRGGSDGCAHSRVLAFDKHHFRIYQAVGMVIGEYLYDFRSRRNGISRYNIRVNLPHCVCYGFITGYGMGFCNSLLFNSQLTEPPF